MNALSLALLYGILWISSVHGSEDNNVRRLSKDISEQDFADLQGENALLSSKDTESSESYARSFFWRNWRDIIVAFCVTVVVPAAIAAIIGTASKGANAAGIAAAVVAFVGTFFFFIIALAIIAGKDELVKEGLTPSWVDGLKYLFKNNNTSYH